jgi:hypothetical protein
MVPDTVDSILVNFGMFCPEIRNFQAISNDLADHCPACRMNVVRCISVKATLYQKPIIKMVVDPVDSFGRIIDGFPDCNGKKYHRYSVHCVGKIPAHVTGILSPVDTMARSKIAMTCRQKIDRID